MQGSQEGVRMLESPGEGVEVAARIELEAQGFAQSPGVVFGDGGQGAGMEREVGEVLVEEEQASGDGEGEGTLSPPGEAGAEHEGGPEEWVLAKGPEDAVAIACEGLSRGVEDVRVSGNGELAHDDELGGGMDGLYGRKVGVHVGKFAGYEGEQDGGGGVRQGRWGRGVVRRTGAGSRGGVPARRRR